MPPEAINLNKQWRIQSKRTQSTNQEFELCLDGTNRWDKNVVWCVIVEQNHQEPQPKKMSSWWRVARVYICGDTLLVFFNLEFIVPILMSTPSEYTLCRLNMLVVVICMHQNVVVSLITFCFCVKKKIFDYLNLI